MSFTLEVGVAGVLFLLIFAWDRLPELVRGLGLGVSELQRAVQWRLRSFAPVAPPATDSLGSWVILLMLVILVLIATVR